MPNEHIAQMGFCFAPYAENLQGGFLRPLRSVLEEVTKEINSRPSKCITRFKSPTPCQRIKPTCNLHYKSILHGESPIKDLYMLKGSLPHENHSFNGLLTFSFERLIILFRIINSPQKCYV